MKRNSTVYFIARWMAQTAFSLFYRIETRSEKTFPMEGSAVILPKHQYWTDIPLVSLSFPFPLLFVAKRELFRYPGIRTFLSLLGGIPLDRERSVRTLNSVRYLLSQLKAAERIVIFPEGTYFRGVVGSGKNRLIRMILRYQSTSEQRIPFVPVGIRYGERSGWRRRVEICIGSPLFAQSESDGPALTCQVMEEISHLCRMPRENEIPESGKNIPKGSIRSTEQARLTGEQNSGRCQETRSPLPATSRHEP
jgi:1-acyl-sn-glycerol-3-phosphate acyltransferase